MQAEKDEDGLRQQQQQHQQSKLQLESEVVAEEQAAEEDAGDSSNRRGAQSPDWEMVELSERSGMASLMEVLESGSVARTTEMVQRDLVEGENFSEAKSSAAFDEIEVVSGMRADNGDGGHLVDQEVVQAADGEKVMALLAKGSEELSSVTKCSAESLDDDAETSRSRKNQSRESVVEQVIKRLEVCEGITEVPQESSVDSTGSEADKNLAQDFRKKEGTGSKSFRDRNGVLLVAGKMVSRNSSFRNPVMPPPSRSDAREAQELEDKVRFLEGELKIKSSELDSMKQIFQEREHEFLKKIECLQLANQQLLDGGADSSVQLQMELSRLQRQNSMLSMRERELHFQISTQEMLNEQLKESNLPNETESAMEAAKILEARIAALEVELAEAVEVNNMYKIQLHNAFAKQKNVHAAALHNAGNVEEVVKELLQLRQRTKAQENELQDLQDRFFLISVRLAESVAQREELLMKVKRIQHLKHH